MLRYLTRSLCLVAVLLAAAPASAALISSFSYTIVGGSVTSNPYTGFRTVLGGTAVFTPTNPIETSVTTNFVGTGALGLFLSLTGGFNVIFPAMPGLTIFRVGPTLLTLDQFATTANGTIVDGLGAHAFAWKFSSRYSVLEYTQGVFPDKTLTRSGPGTVVVGSTIFMGNARLSVMLGNEVRTVVPEAGTASLIGLGLLALAGGAGGRRAAAIRARRRSC